MRVVLVGMAGVLLTVMPSTALADIMFDFNALCLGDSSSHISAYMTDIFNDAVPGGTVTVNGALASGSGIGIGHLVGKSFTIQFSEAITCAGFDGWVLWETSGADFRMFTLDQSGTQIAEVFSKNQAGWTGFSVPRIALGPDVYGLKFSDSGLADVGICNLVVSTANSDGNCVVPAPGAVALVMIGLTLTGLIKRRVA